MIRWFRSVVSVLRRLLWPLPQDPQGATTAQLFGVDTATGRDATVVWVSEDGTEFEFDASLISIGCAVEICDDDQAPEASVAAAEPPAIPPPPAPKPQRPPGRQTIQMPGQNQTFMDMLAGKPSWPGIVAKDAHRAPWEDLHTFPGRKPVRDDHGLHGLDDPLTFTCPGCDLEQPPVRQSERDCPYCGLKIKLFGTYLVWWREAVEPALQWPPKGQGR